MIARPSRRRSAGLLAALALVSLSLIGPAARADVPLAYGASLRLGGGEKIWPGTDRHGIFELAPRAKLLFGRELALGPEVELRTANFTTAELSGGLTGAIPFAGDLGLLAGIGGGYAWRGDGQDGALLTASLDWGLYHVDWSWAASTTLYLSWRHALTGPERDELTAGVSFGGGFLDLLLRMAGGG